MKGSTYTLAINTKKTGHKVTDEYHDTTTQTGNTRGDGLREKCGGHIRPVGSRHHRYERLVDDAELSAD